YASGRTTSATSCRRIPARPSRRRVEDLRGGRAQAAPSASAGFVFAAHFRCRLARKKPARKVRTLVAVPPGVVTCHWSEPTTAGTIARSTVLEKTANGAETPPSFTDVTPTKFVPLMATGVPWRPLDGRK